MLILKYVVAWFGMMVLAILNGAFREMVFTSRMGDFAAHQISTFTLIILISGYVWVLVKFWPIGSARQSWIIGSLWFLMTELFEFGMELMISGIPLNKILDTYNVLEGQLWIFIPLWVLIAPSIFYRFVQTK